MAIRKGSAVWEGSLSEGSGTVSAGECSGQYSAKSRFDTGTGLNPEELIGAAHSACFSMALAGLIEKAGFVPERIDTRARVHINKGEEGYEISAVELITQVEAPELEDEAFQRLAEEAKENCPVSKALAVKQITLVASLRQYSGAAI